jgi:hypothetical protein
MPLFFIFAIAAGGITLGAVTADVTSDARAARAQAHAQAAATFDPSPYATAADCQAAASRAGAPASACNGKI